MNQCKGCQKEVVFLKDENGKTQILDAKAPVYAVKEVTIPVEQSGLVLHKKEKRCVRVKDAFVTHFATCSHADQFSKSKVTSKEEFND